MKLLNFRIPYRSRVQYVSKSALDYWNPIIQKLHKNLRKIERFTALNKNRKLSMQYVTELEFNEGSNDLNQNLHRCISINATPDYHEFYIPDNHFKRLAFTHIDNHIDVDKALLENNLDTVSEYLGYPKCCVDFFIREAKINDLIDPINLIDAKDFNYKNNILLSSIGLNLISHIPCSYNCQESIKIAEERLSMYRTNFDTSDDDLENLRKLLSCKIEWNTLHGIVEIKTPIFKILKHSDAYSHNLVCKFNENCNDDIMYKAIGNKFPYL